MAAKRKSGKKTMSPAQKAALKKAQAAAAIARRKKAAGSRKAKPKAPSTAKNMSKAKKLLPGSGNNTRKGKAITVLQQKALSLKLGMPQKKGWTDWSANKAGTKKYNALLKGVENLRKSRKK
jgi:hypothetical protein